MTSMPVPMRSQEAEEEDDGDEESWHDAREECTKAYETVDEVTKAKAGKYGPSKIHTP